MIWYAVYTNPRAEGALADRLQAEGIETLYLHCKGTSSHARKVTPIKAPLYPRYIFVHPRVGQSIYRIKSTPGVHSILTYAETPVQIPKSVMDYLRSICDRNGFVDLKEEPIKERELYQPGQKVVVEHGLFRGRLGSVRVDKGAEVSVWLEFFSGRVSFDLIPEQVSPVGGTMPAA